MQNSLSFLKLDYLLGLKCLIWQVACNKFNLSIRNRFRAFVSLFKKPWKNNMRTERREKNSENLEGRRGWVQLQLQWPRLWGNLLSPWRNSRGSPSSHTLSRFVGTLLPFHPPPCLFEVSSLSHLRWRCSFNSLSPNPGQNHTIRDPRWGELWLNIVSCSGGRSVRTKQQGKQTTNSRVYLNVTFLGKMK